MLNRKPQCSPQQRWLIQTQLKQHLANCDQLLHRYQEWLNRPPRWWTRRTHQQVCRRLWVCAHLIAQSKALLAQLPNPTPKQATLHLRRLTHCQVASKKIIPLEETTPDKNSGTKS